MHKLAKIHRGLFYLLILLAPTQLTKHFWPSFAFISGIRIDYLAPTIYLTDLLIIVLLIIWLLEHTPTLLRKLGVDRHSIHAKQPIVCFLLLLYIFLNIHSATNSWTALLKWLKIGELALLAFYIIKTKPSLLVTCYLLLVTCLASILLAWLQFLQGGSIGGLLYWVGERTFTLGTPGIARQSFFGREYLRPYATFPHPNVLAGFLTATLSFLFTLKNTLNLKPRTFLFRQILLTIMVAIWLATIFITGSQAALFISLGIVFSYLPNRQKKYVLVSSTAVLVIFLITNYRLLITDYINSPSFTRRYNLNIAALNIVKESPIVGVGLNNFIIRLPEFYKPSDPTFFLQPVHNIYLLTIAEGGLIGLVLLLWLLLKVYNISIFKQIPISNIQYPISLATLLLIGLFDHYLFTLQQGLVLFTVFVALAFNWRKS